MKKYFVIPIVSLLLCSCEDFLSLSPETSINTQSFYKSQNDIETALVGAYSTLRPIFNVDLNYIGDLATDNAEIQLHNVESTHVQIDEISFTAENGVISGYWSNLYTLSARANTVLNRVEGINFDETAKNSVRGQAYFLRALAYFYLVRLFGDVSLIDVEFTSPNQIASFDMSRRPVEDIYAFIINDLNEAAGLLVTTVPDDRGKISLGAVQTLLAKVYLTRKDYARAATELEKVMALKKSDGTAAYALHPDYGALFSRGNDDLIESILEVDFATGNIGLGSSYAYQFYPLLNNMTVFPGNLSMGGRCVPTQSLMEAYEADDNRKDGSVGDQVPTTTEIITSTYCRKFVDYTMTTNNDGGVNFTLLRYADVLLMYAEVLNELDRSGAETYLNMVRNRAGLDSKTGLNKAVFRLAIEQERRVEFAFEQQRWFDLVRTDRLKEVMDAHFISKGQPFRVDAHRWILPVPQGQRDIDPKLSQNQGY